MLHVATKAFVGRRRRPRVQAPARAFAPGGNSVRSPEPVILLPALAFARVPEQPPKSFRPTNRRPTRRQQRKCAIVATETRRLFSASFPGKFLELSLQFLSQTKLLVGLSALKSVP